MSACTIIPEPKYKTCSQWAELNDPAVLKSRTKKHIFRLCNLPKFFKLHSLNQESIMNFTLRMRNMVGFHFENLSNYTQT